MPSLPITVTWDLYDAIKADCGEPFADSYLSGAVEGGGVLVTKTHYAKDKLRFTPQSARVLAERKLRLEGPDYFERLEKPKAA